MEQPGSRGRMGFVVPGRRGGRVEDAIDGVRPRLRLSRYLDLGHNGLRGWSG